LEEGKKMASSEKGKKKWDETINDMEMAYLFGETRFYTLSSFYNELTQVNKSIVKSTITKKIENESKKWSPKPQIINVEIGGSVSNIEKVEKLIGY
jgi:hypothetical protein